LGDALAVGVGVAEGVERIGVAGFGAGAKDDGIDLGLGCGEHGAEGQQRRGDESALEESQGKIASRRSGNTHRHV
jgi:hypothetical protein